MFVITLCVCWVYPAPVHTWKIPVPCTVTNTMSDSQIFSWYENLYFSVSYYILCANKYRHCIWKEIPLYVLLFWFVLYSRDSIVLCLTGPTTHWSYDRLFRWPINPIAHWSYDLLVLNLLGPTVWKYFAIHPIGPDSLVLRLIGPTSHWS